MNEKYIHECTEGLSIRSLKEYIVCVVNLKKKKGI